LAGWLGEVAAPVWVRVNSDGDGLADIEALAHTGGVAGFCLAKASVAQVEAASRLLDQLASSAALAPLLEDAQAILHAARMARLPRVARLQLGEADLRGQLGLEPSDGEPELLAIRSQVVLASTAAGLPAPPAPVSTNFTTLAAFAANTRALRRLGFHGRTCIHPAQVEIVNSEFAVRATELARAQSVIDALEQAGGGVTRGDDGQMIDEAIARAARRPD